MKLIRQASADFQNAENFGLPEPPGFDLDNEQEQDSKEEAAKLDSQNVEEPAELKEAKNRIAEKIEKSQEEVGEGEEIVQGSEKLKVWESSGKGPGGWARTLTRESGPGSAKVVRVRGRKSQ